MFYKLIKKRIVEFDINRIAQEGFFNISYTSFFTDVDISDPTQPGVHASSIIKTATNTLTPKLLSTP